MADERTPSDGDAADAAGPADEADEAFDEAFDSDYDDDEYADDVEDAADGVDAFHRRLHHIAPAQLVGDTAQTSGMQRHEAISGKTVGSLALWMGETHVPANTDSGNHHHGHSETAIYVVSGNPVFVFLDEDTGTETRIETSAGDYVFVPPWVPHREENPDPATEAVVVIARTTQEAIVVNVPDLHWVGPIATTADLDD